MKKTNYDYDSKIEDVDEVIGTDIKINPDYYIHHALLKAQAALSNEDLKTGLLQFRIMVEHIEILATSAKLIPDDYEKKITEYKKSKEYNLTEPQKEVRLAHYKLKLMCSKIFSQKTTTTAMKI